MTDDPNKADARFSTEGLVTDMSRRSARGGLVTLGAQGARFVLQLGSTAVLARLLEVSDFGMIAMVTALTGFVAMFQDAGLSMATVQRAQLSHAQVSNLFWANLLLGVLAMGATAALAPGIAWFYGREEFVAITLVSSIAFLFGGAAVQPQALLRRDMRFTALAAIEILAMAGGVGVAIALAANGAGYWALVAMPIATAAMQAAVAWSLCGWWPSFPSRGSGVRELLRFGQQILSFNVINYFARRADDIMIGRQWGADALGFYSKAYALLLLPMQQINRPLTSVAIPALSALRSTPERYRRFYGRGIEAATLAGMPMVVVLFVLAPEVVLLVLGDAWGDAVPIFRMLVPAAMMATTNVATGWVYVSWGHVDRQLKWGVFASIILVLGMALGLPYGAIGVAFAVSATRVLLKVPGLWFCFRDTPVRVGDFGRAIWRAWLAAFVSGAALIEFKSRLRGSFELPLFAEIVVLSMAFGLCYLVFLVAVPGGWTRLASLWEALRGARKSQAGGASPTA